MPRLIDANNLLALVKKNAPFIYSILAPIILLCPTIGAEPVRHGKWVVKKVDATVSNFQCSECGREERCGNDYFMKPTKHVNAIYPYCHCGAKMDLE